MRKKVANVTNCSVYYSTGVQFNASLTPGFSRIKISESTSNLHNYPLCNITETDYNLMAYLKYIILSASSQMDLRYSFPCPEEDAHIYHV